jgi:hypothetical protein
MTRLYKIYRGLNNSGLHGRSQNQNITYAITAAEMKALRY